MVAALVYLERKTIFADSRYCVFKATPLLVFGIALFCLAESRFSTLSKTDQLSAVVLAIILMVQGIFTLIGFFRHRKMHGAGWLLFNSLITILLSLLIWWDGPGAAVWVIGTLVGIHLIFSGISRFMIWGAVRKSLSPAPA